MKNYSNERSYEEYRLQPIEVDTVDRTYTEMVWNNELYNEPDYQKYLTMKNEDIKRVKNEAIRVYGPDYQKKLDNLRKIGSQNPQIAEKVEREYRERQARYERFEE